MNKLYFCNEKIHFMKRAVFLIFVLLLSSAFSMASLAEGNSIYLIDNYLDKKEKVKKPKKDKTVDSVRKGWTFGILPSVAYDADKGFQGGLLSNVYYFGDGSQYPDYIHSFYFEAAYTTTHCGLFRFMYDSKYLIPKHRLTVDISYLPDAICDFYGYNGYQSVLNREWANDKKYPDTYKSRVFYKSRRDMLRIAGDISGNISGNWYWNAGLGVQWFSIGSVNVDMINKGKKPEKQLPLGVEGLYEKYVKWGIIDVNEAKGGWRPYLRAGVTYDSRDKQQNPNKGIYADAFLTYTAAFGNQKQYNNLKLNVNFRHYVPVYKDIVLFAYRLSMQLTTAGKSAFYENNVWNTLYIQRATYEVLGGSNTLRGIARNRVTANGFAFANVEFRFKVCRFSIKKEHFYIGLNPFFDAGMVIQPYKLNQEEIIQNIQNNDPEFNLNELNQYIVFDKSQIYRPHMAAGLGLKIAMNENFVLSVDWAVPFDKRDNANQFTNFYVKMNYMF